MTVYVFDSGPLIILFRHYYRQSFQTLWKNYDAMIANNKIISVREVRQELSNGKDDLASWCKNNISTFPVPSPQEGEFVSKIFAVPHFQQLISSKNQLKGSPVADPFVIAKAACIDGGCVVTQEKYKENAAKIPNVCKHFGIDCIDLEEFMNREKWSF